MELRIDEVNEVIDREIEFAKSINPHMAMGMRQIKLVINQYHDERSKEY